MRVVDSEPKRKPNLRTKCVPPTGARKPPAPHKLLHLCVHVPQRGAQNDFVDWTRHWAHILARISAPEASLAPWIHRPCPLMCGHNFVFIEQTFGRTCPLTLPLPTVELHFSWNSTTCWAICRSGYRWVGQSWQNNSIFGRRLY